MTAGFPGRRGLIKIDVTEIHNYFRKIILEEYNDRRYSNSIVDEKIVRTNILTDEDMFDNDSKVLERKHDSPKQPPTKQNSSFAPHVDVLNDWFRLFAATTWLNLPEECHGGTGFWKNKFMDTEFYYYHKARGVKYLLDELKKLPIHRRKIEHWEKIKDKDERTKFLSWPWWNRAWLNGEVDDKDDYLLSNCWSESNSEWEFLGYTPMKFNRMVIYQSNAFHTQYIEKPGYFNKYPRISLQHFI